MKSCTKCKVEYPITSEYWQRNKKNKDGFRPDCKKCCSKRKKQYYQKNKERIKEKSCVYRNENKDYYKEYQKQWYKKNKDSVQEYLKENKDHIEQRSREYYLENRTHLLNYTKQHQKENREHYREYGEMWRLENREYLSEYRKANKKQMREAQRKWRERNPEKSRLKTQKRRAIKKNLPHTLSKKEWLETKQIFNNSCAYCGMTGEEHGVVCGQQLHQDHFVPLSKGGGYTKENIIPACRSCNSSKHNTYFEEWYPSQEYYSEERELKILNYLDSVYK